MDVAPPACEVRTDAMPLGNLRGSAVSGGLQYFAERYGRAAIHDIYARQPADARVWMSPHAPMLGLLPTRLYPYPNIGRLLRTMAQVVHATDEDAFLATLAHAGVNATMTTVNRIALRWLVSPSSYASRAQEIWNLYHDSGRLTVLPSAPNELVVQIDDWPNHDLTVCKVCVEGRRRILELIGVRPIEARRSKCRGWGDATCVQYLRW